MTTMVKRILKIGIVVCMLAALTIALSACSKDNKTTYKKISGTWYLIDNPACRWTFEETMLPNPYIPYRQLHINILDTYSAIDCYYLIENNTLTLHQNGGLVSANAYLSIDEINNKRLKISGTIEVYDYGSHVPININYEFKKSN